MKIIGKIGSISHIELENLVTNLYDKVTVVRGADYTGYKIDIKVNAILITEYERVPKIHAQYLDDQIAKFFGDIWITENEGTYI